MTVLRVRFQNASINVSFKLSRFLTDWPTAQQKFICGIVDGFRDLYPIQPRDFSVTPALSLEDLRCRCQLFRGACSIVLSPDSLQVDFVDVKQHDHPVVEKAIRRSEAWFSSAFGDHEREWFSCHTLAHLQAVDDDAVDAYLNQFVRAKTDEVCKSEPNVKLHPSTHVVLSDQDEMWRVRRVVERSAAFPNGIFMDTWVQIHGSNSASFDDQVTLIAHLDKLADRAIGVQYEGA